jgi:hypothetical protein
MWTAAKNLVTNVTLLVWTCSGEKFRLLLGRKGCYFFLEFQ